MSLTLARMVAVRSESTEMSIAAGIHRRKSGSMAFTRSTVSITLASGCLRMMSSTAALWSNFAAERVLRVPCSIVATLASRTTLPALVLSTIAP